MADTNTVFPAVFDASFDPNPNWLIDGVAVPRQISETVTPTTLTLQYRVTTNILTSALRPLKGDEGKVTVLDRDDGGHTAVDRADGSNTYLLEPPSKRTPLRETAEYHVQQYEEDLVSQDVGEWSVEVEFVRSEPRTDSLTLSDPAGGATFDWTFDQVFERRTPAAWGFTTSTSTFWSDRVDAEFVGTGEGGVRRFEIIARFTRDEARVWESDLGRLGGARIREIPDAPNVAVDDSGGDATVTLDPPTSAVVPAGDYTVIEWSSSRISEAYQSVSMVVAEQ